MKIPSRFIHVAISAIAILTAAPFARATTDVWTGSGGSADFFWNSPTVPVDINWNNGVPQTGYDLVFTNTIGLVNSNNISSGSFNSITFATPSGAFDLKGVQTTLTGGITNNQANTPETIEFPIVVSGNVNVDVAVNGALTLTNTISGSGNLSKSSAGTLTLNGRNTFTGTLSANGGTIVIGSDTNLNAPPASPTAGNIVLNGGALQTTATMGLNPNRGIALGPTSGSGSGTFNVNIVTTLTNSSIMANNGSGAGGLTKLGFGNMILFGANTYTGPTTNTIGSIILDFTQPGAPTGANGIIKSTSALAMGGGNAGPTTTNTAQLIMAGTASGNAQSFASSFFTLGASVIGVTNRNASGTATLNLGALSHDPDSGLTFFSSPSARAIITTTSPNVGGILGGWATIAGDADGPSIPSDNVVNGTNWACVDISGHIVQFNNYYVVNTVNDNTNFLLHNIVDANTTGCETNILVGDAAGDVLIAFSDIDHTGDPGRTTDINSIKFINTPNGSGVYIGQNNTLRLGQYGGILSVQTANVTPVIGGVSNLVNGISASQAPFGSLDVGNLTAGGPNNDTAGEIVITHSTTMGETTGGLIVASRITDNGSGKVSVVKMGNGSIKLDADNTFSGGLYLLQGRVQWQGSEIEGTSNGGPGGTNGLNNGGGFGPVYILPGSYFAPNTSIPNITNDFFVAGAGGASEKFGVFRGGNFGGNITMVGDATMCSDSANVFGPIHGPFNLTIGAPNRCGNLTLSNSGNDWTGNTIMQPYKTAGNTLTNGNNEVIPNGFGKGNVSMIGTASLTFRWNMNGFSETINGFSSSGVNNNSDTITNDFSHPLSTLTIGDNDQSGLFGGIIESNIALTKIGAGVETFTNINTYRGATTISGGILQLTGSGSINNSTNVSINGGTFDVSASAYTVPSSQNINISSGTWFISTASGASSSVSITNGTLKVATLNTVAPNLTASTINLGSGANLIQPVTMPLISVYPQTFIVASYTTLNGIDHTNSLGVILPAGGFPAFAGYVTVDTVHNQILLVATNGPITPSLTWAGFNYNTLTLDGNWNFGDDNWTNIPAHTKTSYTDGSLLTFDDSGLSSTVNLTTTFVPVGVTVANTNVNYTFIGTGAIVSTNGVTKLGSGKLTLDETGGDSYNGLTIAAGTVQIGINDNGGSVGTNLVGNNGTLVFNRANSVLNISNTISGSGSLLVSNAASTTTVLSGSSSFSGDVYVVPNVTLIPANSGALSSTNGTLTIPTGATLDVGGQGVAGIAVEKVVSVQGAGVDGTSGAIVNNTTTNQTTALLRVSLAGDTTVGGIGRFDIRGTGASLRGAFNLIKKGTGQFSLVGTAVDPAVENIDVQAGTFSVETTTTGLGNPADTLTIETPAMLQVYNATNQLNKQIVLNGNGSTTTLTNGNGNNTIAGPMTLGGTGPVLVAGGANTTLTLSNAISGGGSLTKNSLNTLVLTGPDTGGANDTYTGTTIVNDGTLVINGINSGSILTENLSATSVAGNVATVGGNGTNGAATDIEDTLWPGVAGKPATFGAGNNDEYNGGDGALVFNDSGAGVPRAVFSLNTSTTAGGGVNDLVTVNGDFNGNFSTHVFINPQTPLTVAGTPYTLVTYTGIKQNNFNGTAAVVGMFQPSRYSFSLDYSTTGVVKLDVLTGAGNLIWNNNAGNGIWDANVSANWLNTGTSLSDVFLQLDTVTFDDSIGGGQTTINLATNLVPGSVTVNSTLNYTFTGAGSISGAVNLIKQGSGTLNINNSNNFTGTVTVSGGTLAANTNNALGSSALVVYGGTLQVNAANPSLVSTLITNGTVLVNNTNGLGGVTAPIYVTNSGTLDIGGASLTVNQIPLLGSEPIYISGWGVNSNGCLINSGTNQEDSAQNIIMTGDAAIGGNGGLINAINGGRFDLGRLTNNPTLSTGGNPYNLYKVGSNQVSLVNVAVDPSLNNIDIKGGELGFETGTTFGNPAGTLTVESGATLEFFDTANTLSKTLIVNGGGPAQGIYANIWFNGGAVPENSISGLMIVTNGEVVIGGAASGTISNTIIGPSSLRIAGVVHFDGTNTYTGNTTVSNNGTLFLDGTATINNSPNITVLGGTNDIDVTGRTNNTLTLAGSQTFSGFGIINGTLTAPSGTTVTVGTNGAVGQLTVTTNANLSGILNMKLNKGGATNDVLSVGGQVNYGGALILNTNLSGALLVAGDSFKLFNATTYSGSFASISPAHPNNDLTLNWDTSSLTVDGSLKVAGSGAGTFTNPTGITGISLVGVNVVVTGTNGQSGDAYYLLQSTNVALPLSQWKTIATNVLGANGNYTFIGTNAVTSGDQQQFYILSNTNSNPQ